MLTSARRSSTSHHVPSRPDTWGSFGGPPRAIQVGTNINTWFFLKANICFRPGSTYGRGSNPSPLGMAPEHRDSSIFENEKSTMPSTSTRHRDGVAVRQHRTTLVVSVDRGPLSAAALLGRAVGEEG